MIDLRDDYNIIIEGQIPNSSGEDYCVNANGDLQPHVLDSSVA
jgi:hypothetical protein